MRVVLLQGPGDALGICAAAARSCYSDRPASDLLDQPMPRSHGSVLEHASFTFSIEGISRVCSHQLVRHRLASFSQQSMRYVRTDKIRSADGGFLVLPGTVRALLESGDPVSTEALETYLGALDGLLDALGGKGIPSEDLRYFMPDGTKTNVVMTMNYRELMHACGLRMCTRAQAEIREVFGQISAIIKEKYPELWAYAPLTPQCYHQGRCPEPKGCGRPVPSDRLRVFDRRG